MRLRPFAVVRVFAIRADRFRGAPVTHARHPRIGDVGAILEADDSPEAAHELECAAPASGATVWLEAMFPDEIEPV